MRDSCVVYQDVQTAIGTERRVHHRSHRSAICDVDLYPKAFDLCRDLMCAINVQIRDNNACAFFCELADNPGSEP